MSKKTDQKPDRLTRRSDFLRVQGAERKWVSPTVIVQAGKAESANVRYGITATKKLGNAVARNRIKRRLRAAVRETLREAERAGQSTPHDIVLIGRSDTATCDFKTLTKDLRWCLKRLEVTHAQKPA